LPASQPARQKETQPGFHWISSGVWQAAGQTVELLVRILLMELQAVGEQARVPALPDELKENLQVN